MTERNIKRALLLFVSVLTGGGIYFIFSGDKKSAPSAEPSEGSTAAPPATLHETSPPTKSHRSPVDAVQKNKAPSHDPSSGIDTRHKDEAETAPACSSDADCRGPRTADCIQAVCETGICRNDESACGCSSHDDCKDNDPCTRDHCFARTMQCVFIPMDGCK